MNCTYVLHANDTKVKLPDLFCHSLKHVFHSRKYSHYLRIRYTSVCTCALFLILWTRVAFEIKICLRSHISLENNNFITSHTPQYTWRHYSHYPTAFYSLNILSWWNQYLSWQFDSSMTGAYIYTNWKNLCACCK